MDPITIILTALAAGVATGLTDTTKTAIADSYTALKGAISARFTGNTPAEVALQEYPQDPDTYDKPLRKHLTENGMADDEHILALARAIVDHKDATGTTVGRYVVDARGARNVQTGDHNTQINK